MQALCGLQGIFDLFNCKTPVYEQIREKVQRFILVCYPDCIYNPIFDS